MRSRYRCYPGARLCVQGVVAVLFCELDACAEDALRGHCLGDVFGLTCELVEGQNEPLQRAQLSDALRDRACMYRNVRESSVVGFD